MTDQRPATVEPSPPEGEDPPVRVGLLLGVLLVSVAVAVLANSMVLVLVPEIGRDFAASPGGLAWVVTAFSLTFAVTTPLYGRVADVFGVRRVFAFGLAVFIAGSLLAGLAPDIGWHLVGRVLQGGGSAAVPALGSVAIARALPPGRRGFGFGIVGTGVGAGQALGPPLAGFVAEVGGWRWPFIGAALLIVPVLIVAPRVLPDGRPDADATWRQIDLVGGVLLGAAVGLGLFGLTRGQQVGFGAVVVLGRRARGGAARGRVHRPHPPHAAAVRAAVPAHPRSVRQRRGRRVPRDVRLPRHDPAGAAAHRDGQRARGRAGGPRAAARRARRRPALLARRAALRPSRPAPAGRHRPGHPRRGRADALDGGRRVGGGPRPR